ncbi:SPFH domain-containing protein [Frankia sp. CiP1_Cm_nod1]|uniref:SPFH domain-containing protein n=1 Tax=Frankia sp. CiP1_Cm_nod1 TaxID=2897160 RepID=UPI002023D7CC
MSTESSEAATRIPAAQIQERPVNGVPGWAALALSLAVVLLLGPGAIAGGILLVLAFSGPGRAGGVVLVVLGSLLVLGGAVTLFGLTAVAPGQARVLSLFGRYTGTIRTTGLRWVNPFSRRRKISTRIRNHETTTVKVNDADGNPIEIAAVVVWQVRDTARAVYEVDSFVEFVGTQAETAVRHIATSYPYDNHGDATLSLRENAAEITGRLSEEIAARVASAGVRIIESRITRLAYAPEIAHAMLRRQQAGAVVAARQRIVEGAVGMVELALARLEAQDIVALDDERKAAMVSNLLVVLCSEQSTQPVVNTGSLYH